MNSYFDQQWDQQLAGRPQALAAFTSLSPAAQERIVGYVQSCDNTHEASRRISRMLAQLEAGEYTPSRNNPHKKAAAESLFAFLGSFLLIYWRPASL